jgi:hypothetical protein
MPARTLPRFTRWTALELVCLALALLLASNGLSHAAMGAFVVFVVFAVLGRADEWKARRRRPSAGSAARSASPKASGSHPKATRLLT